jgi:2-polyprenyl-3-methyl-5-hydroxy-6-metoxy-1,4-benzoquinol methylase
MLLGAYFDDVHDTERNATNADLVFRTTMSKSKQFGWWSKNPNQEVRDAWIALKAGQSRAGIRVLDVGAGSGRYRDLFKHCEYRTHDFAQEPGTVGNYTDLDYVSDITAIPVEAASFDVAICTEVLEHVPEPQAALREIARILRPGGSLLLTAPLGSFLHQEPYHFYGGFTPHWYARFLPEVGLELVSIEANGGFFLWFAQEAKRFNALIDPRRVPKGGTLRIVLALLWLVTLPFCRVLFPLVADRLDSLGLERMATVGYHVVARRQGAV